MGAVELEGRSRAVVVGGSTGIGFGLAAGFVREGYEVHILSRRRPDEMHAGMQWHECDLEDAAGAAAVMRRVAAEPLGIVCFSAAFYGPARNPLVATPETEWRRQVDVMLHGAWLTLSTTLSALAEARPGLLVGVSSEVVFNAGPDRSGYAAVKAGASAMMRSARREYEEGGINLVEVLPEGMVDSPGIRARRPAEFDYSGYMTWQDFVPVGAMLARERGAHSDGQVLAVGPGGRWRTVSAETAPPSQSRSARA